MPVCIVTSPSEFDSTELIGVFDYTLHGKAMQRRAIRLYKLINGSSEISLHHTYMNSLKISNGKMI